MRVSAIQFESRGESKAAAVDRAVALMDRARGSNLLLLPELWPSGFFSFERYAADAEDLDGRTVRLLRDRATALKSHIFTGSFVERDGAKLYNTALLLDDQGRIAARYRKMHLFGHGGSREPHYLTPGCEVVVVETPWGRAGLSTCYDLRFPELYRRMIDLGAELFLVTAAWPKTRVEAWMLFLRARAAENQALLLACNAAGTSEGQALGGHSQFVDATGKVLAGAGEGEEVLAAEVEPASVRAAREQFGALKDRVLGKTSKAEKGAHMALPTEPAPLSTFDASTLRCFTDGAAYLSEFETGFYPGAKNEIPQAHQQAGVRAAAAIRPLDAEGRPSDAGRVAALVLGHSNCRQYFNALGGFLEARRAELHPGFALLNAAVGGQQLPYIVNLKGMVWDRAVEVMGEQKVTPAQVQALFLHTTWHGAKNRERMDPGPFPQVMREMERSLAVVLAHCVKLYPNLRVAYLTCDGFRHFTGFEPHVWREAFAFKWLIEEQISGGAGTPFEGPARVLPWLQWGPYVWDNTMGQECFTDGVHPAPQTEQRFAEKYWSFLKSDPVAKGWLVR